MLCTIYKSLLKANTYLYIEIRDDFSKVPPPLLETFGRPQFVTLLNLDKRAKLALADKQKVINQLQTNGFYLQIPPPVENLLDQHLEALEKKVAKDNE
jgi:uncharacterized protein YcgL (UPF0745 family)